MKKSSILKLITLLAWVSFLIYFFTKGMEEFILALFMPLIFGGLLYFSIRKQYFILPLFFSLSFAANAVSPAFFFMDRDTYSYSGFSAVKGFNFDIYEFLIIYGNLFVLLALILLLTIYFYSLLIKRNHRLRSLKINSDYANDSKCSIALFEQTVGLSVNRRFYNLTIVFFVICILTPLNILMYVNGLGISTVEPEELPFKIIGILFYFRGYIAPAILGYLYFKSSRKSSITTLIILYAVLVGVLSLSKSSVILTCLPVIAFAYIDKKLVRLAITILCVMFLYSFIAWSRQFVFITEVGSIEMISFIFHNLSFDVFADSGSLISTIGQLSARLYGAQCMVLVYQHNLSDQMMEIASFFHGSSESMSDIVFYDLFGLEPAPGVVIGVGIGYLAAMLLLANKSILILSFLALITAAYLATAECIVSKYIRSENSIIRAIGYALGFFMVFYLYDTYLEKFYFLVAVSIGGLWLIKLSGIEPAVKRGGSV